MSSCKEKRMPLLLRSLLFFLFLGMGARTTQADDVLFIGNSFTFGGSAPVIQKNGGVPKLFEAIARALGHRVTTTAVTSGGKDWAYHLQQPITAQTLGAKPWTWVVLQDFSSRPTRIGNIQAFMQDGETFSAKIAQTSPRAGIILYETWARPPGKFYQTAPGNAFSGPKEMIAELHQSYLNLCQDLAAQDPKRPVRVAAVGTAFARTTIDDPAIPLDAADHHHSTPDGYYEAALLIERTIYPGSVHGAPATFFHGALNIPAQDAAELQKIADQVASGR
jgi:hypothetical protein